MNATRIGKKVWIFVCLVLFIAGCAEVGSQKSAQAPAIGGGGAGAGAGEEMAPPLTPAPSTPAQPGAVPLANLDRAPVRPAPAAPMESQAAPALSRSGRPTAPTPTAALPPAPAKGPSGRPAADEPARAEAPQGEPVGQLEDCSLAELRRRAATAGIVGRSRLRKDELVRALRSSSGEV